MTPATPDKNALGAVLTAGACALAPLVTELPPWVVVTFAAAAGWRYLSAARRVRLPGRAVVAALMLLVIAGVLRQYGSLLGREPGTALLVALLGLKFLELRNRRDFMLCLFLFQLVILAGFLNSQSLWIGVWAPAAVVVSLAAMIRLNQPTGIGPAALLRLAATLVAKAVPLMLFVYLLFPRISGTLWGLPADAHSGLTGMSDLMHPGSIRYLSESPAVAFRASFTGAVPPARELYWRGRVLWDTDGRSGQRGRPPDPARAALTPLAPAATYNIVLEPSNKPWMFALDLPATAPPAARVHGDFTLEARGPITERQNYTLTSYTRYRTGALDDAERRRALLLPGDANPRTRALAEAWRRRHADPRAVVQAALEHFHRENFVYTLSPPLLGDEPTDEFLFGARRGFCEHYAAAFVALMRAAGVPSRVVNGYQGGEYNAAGNYLIVRQSDAHAWAEVWLPQEGWVRVDPTAAVAPERVEHGSDAVRRLEAQGLALGSLSAAAVLRAVELGWFEFGLRRAQWYWDLTNLAWYRWVVDYGKERQERFLAALGLDGISWGVTAALLGAGTAALLALYALFLWRRRARVDPVQAQYLRFCRKLARIGIARAAHEGPLDYARRTGRRRPDLRAGVEAITHRYTRLRYGRGADEELRTLRHEIAAFRPPRIKQAA